MRGDERYRDAFQARLRMLKMLHDSGISLVAGSVYDDDVVYAALGISPPH